MARKAKKPKLAYADDDRAKAAELEEFLFGGPSKVLKDVQDQEEKDTPLDVASLIHQVASQGTVGDDDFFFLEDRAGYGTDDDEQQEQQEPEAGEQQEAAESEDGEEGQRGQQQDSDDEAGPGPGSQQQQKQGTKRRKDKGGQQAVWHDPADAALRIDVASKARLRKLRSAKGQTTLSGAAYERALRGQHAALNPRTSWAQLAPAKASFEIDERLPPPLEGDEDEDDASELLRTAGGLLETSGRGASGGPLAPGSIEMSRLRDANQHGVSAAVVRSVRFHPNGQLLLTAGFDKKLRFFGVDGLRNPLLQTVFLADCPVQRADFAAGGGAAIASGRRPYYYVYDMHAARVEKVKAPQGSAGAGPPKSIEAFAACGSEANPLLAFLCDGGHVALASLRSRQGVGGIKMNGTARCATFDAEGTQLITSGGDGVIYTWDLRTRRCLHQQVDEGNIGATALALSPDGTHLASGSASGVVNVYRRPASLLEPLALGGALGAAGSAAGMLGGSAHGAHAAGGGMMGVSGAGGGVPMRSQGGAPLKELLTLTTAADTLEWSPDGQILAMGSRLKRDALRLVHVPSFTTFSNWPTSRTPLHYVHSCAFSPHSRFLSIGNAKGHALLYRLHHYY